MLMWKKPPLWFTITAVVGILILVVLYNLNALLCNMARFDCDAQQPCFKPMPAFSSFNPAHVQPRPMSTHTPCRAGFQRHRKSFEGPIATLVSPVRPAAAAAAASTPLIFESWRRLLPQVEVVVVSHSCELIRNASHYGLSTYYIADISLAWFTYAKYIEVVAEAVPTAILGFVNGDILLDRTLVDTIVAIKVQQEQQQQQQQEQHHHKMLDLQLTHILLTGRRYNVDFTLPYTHSPKQQHRQEQQQQHQKEEQQLQQQLQQQRTRNEVEYEHVLHHILHRARIWREFAMDYFIFDRHTPIHVDPKALLGGVGVDSWFASQPKLHPQVTFIDTSLTVNAIHINHGPSGQSHTSLASQDSWMVLTALWILHGLLLFVTRMAVSKLTQKEKNIAY